MTTEAQATRPRIVERSVAAGADLPGINSALLRRIYAGRGIRDAAELDYRLAALPHFALLKGIEAAVEALREAILAGRLITIVGDFDADGATSTTLAAEVLAALGARVDFFMPQRAVHGYGLSPAAVAAIGPAERGGGLILTVDNGIASIDGVAAARQAGWQVVVSDHHLPGETLPAADAIVNPNQPGCPFASKCLAGVGVVFYLMAALRAGMAEAGPAELPNMAELLDLVAVGTVADVVPLDRVNRILISQGLRRIRAGRGRPGIMALAEAAGRDYRQLDAEDIGFAIAPRLNAAGRLEDMRLGVTCLRAGSPESAATAARALASLNRQRQGLQQRMQAEAETALANMATEATDRPALVVHERGWHEGIVGLIAARLRERIQRPVIAFAPGAGGLLKGSARSIPGLHIRAVIAAVEAASPGLIHRFGGHAQAAGLTLVPDALAAFTQHFEAAVAARLSTAMCQRKFVTDGALAAGEHDLATALLLREAGPWGAGFEAPQFHGLYHVLTQRVVGRGHLQLELQPAVGGNPVKAIIFNQAETLDADVPHRLVFQLQVENYRGRRRASMIVSWQQALVRTAAGAAVTQE